MSAQRSRSAGRPLAAVAVALPIALGLSAAPTGVAAQTHTMKIGTATINDVQHEWMKRFKARVEKRSAGKIVVKLFPASQLGRIPRMIEGMQLGTVESLVTPSAFLVGLDRRNSVLMAPGLFQGVSHCWRTLGDKEFRSAWFPMMEKKGIVAIGMLCAAPLAFLTKKKITRLSDLRGQRIRVLASPLEIEPMKAIGVKPIPMPLGAVVTGLRQGTIDGVSSIPVLFGKLKMDTVAKHITTTNHVYVGVPIYVSTKFWNKLSPGQREMMRTEARAAELDVVDWNDRANAGILEAWKKRGGMVAALPPADQAKLMETVSAAANRVLAADAQLAAFHKRIGAIVQRHRK